MSDYRYDVFVSYPRRGIIQEWTRDVLVPQLVGTLEDSGIDGDRVFWDGRLEDGRDWPEDLQQAHLRSKVVVAVLSVPYFKSGWCVAEWTTAYAREKLLKESGEPFHQVVFPLRFNDATEDHLSRLEDKTVVDQVKARSYRDFHPYASLVKEQVKAASDLAHQFRHEVRQLSEQLSQRIHEAPAWREGWPLLPARPISGRDPAWNSRF